MSIKEQIRAKIKRLIQDKTLVSTMERSVGAHTALLTLLHFIDSLPEQPMEGLEEELKRYLNSDEYINTRENGTLLIARHFAEWQKAKMQEGAVEGEVCHFASVHYLKTNESQLFARLKQFKPGDKVRIIIVKEE